MSKVATAAPAAAAAAAPKAAEKASDKKSDAPKSVTTTLVFNNTDLFADADDKTGGVGGGISIKKGPQGSGIVHIRVQQRNGRKSLTTVQGLPNDLDLKKILRALKKTFSTNGTILKDEELGKVIQLQGDQRKSVLEFLIKTHICEKNDIKMHGF